MNEIVHTLDDTAWGQYQINIIFYVDDVLFVECKTPFPDLLYKPRKKKNDDLHKKAKFMTIAQDPLRYKLAAENHS